MRYLNKNVMKVYGWLLFFLAVNTPAHAMDHINHKRKLEFEEFSEQKKHKNSEKSFSESLEDFSVIQNFSRQMTKALHQQQMFQAANDGEWGIAKKYVRDSNLDINIQDDKRNTLLHYWVESPEESFFQFLISKKIRFCEPNLKNS
jgi:ankyrin repeat protein